MGKKYILHCLKSIAGTFYYRESQNYKEENNNFVLALSGSY